MALPPQNILAWEVCMTILQGIAIASTVIRLVHRWRTSRMWWDDWVVIVPLVVDCLYLSLMWVEAEIPSLNSANLLFSLWFNAFIFFIIVWASRISLAFSIARIFPPNHGCRRFAFGLAFSFLFLCLAGVLLTFGLCFQSSTIWYNNSVRECAAKRKTGGLVGFYVMVAFEFLADIALIVSPVAMLWKIKLPRPQRRLVLALFSSSILSVLASITFFTCLSIRDTPGPGYNVIIAMTAQLQSAVSLLVCNLLVVTMLFYRIMQRRQNLSNNNNDVSHEPQDHTNKSEKQSSVNLSQVASPDGHTNAMSLSSPHTAHGNSITFTSIFSDPTPQSSAHLSSQTHGNTSCPSSSFYGENITGLSGGPQVSPWSFSDTDNNVTASGS